MGDKDAKYKGNNKMVVGAISSRKYEHRLETVKRRVPVAKTRNVWEAINAPNSWLSYRKSTLAKTQLYFPPFFNLTKNVQLIWNIFWLVTQPPYSIRHLVVKS